MRRWSHKYDVHNKCRLYVHCVPVDSIMVIKQRIYIWDRFRRSNACFFKIRIFFRSMKCPLHFASYALRIGVSVMELQSAEYFISPYISTQALHFSCAHWKFYNVCARSLFTETIPHAYIQYNKVQNNEFRASTNVKYKAVPTNLKAHTNTTIYANLGYDDVHLPPQPPECIHELLRLPMDAHPAAIDKDLGGAAKQGAMECQRPYCKAIDFLTISRQTTT